jgi:imidazolonepropionase-like amidohydrolase
MGGGTEPEPRSIRRAVAEHAERGVDVIKVMASGGTLTSGTRQERTQYSQDMLRTVVAEAHRWGLPVTAHAHGTASIAESLAAGVDGMEHVTFWAEDGIDAPQSLLDRIAKSGVFVGATLGFDPPGDYAGLPTPLRSRLPRIDQNTARLRDAGARVVVGSDAGVASVKHHAVLPYAASQLSAMGANPTQVLETLTSAAAAACGVEDRKGWLRPGYDADVLVVRGDPTQDLAALHAVRIVVRAGRVLVDTGDAQPA